MIQTKIFDGGDLILNDIKSKVVSFLYTHLEHYGDRREDIARAYDFTAATTPGGGGKLIVAHENDTLVGSALINRTGMEGYIPENILVYIATHIDHRGKGIAAEMMSMAISNCEGGIALHVEPDNPALKLYEKFGFTNKYLEMRLNRKEVADGVPNA